MSFGEKSSDSTIPAFKKFVSEEEIEDQRKKRQEEWEKVRKPEEPLEAPEEEIDSRCLFQKLQEQKQKKDDEFAEKHRLSNQVKGLDNEEADFLDFVSEKKEEINKKREEQETEVLTEYRNAVMNQVTDLTSATDAKLKSGTKQASNPPAVKRSQQALLAGAVKRKSQDFTNSSVDKKVKTDADSSTICASGERQADLSPVSSDSDTPRSTTTHPVQQVATVVGILPGLGAYDNSSDSDNSSSSDSDIELPGDILRKKVVIYQEH